MHLIHSPMVPLFTPLLIISKEIEGLESVKAERRVLQAHLYKLQQRGSPWKFRPLLLLSHLLVVKKTFTSIIVYAPVKFITSKHMIWLLLLLLFFYFFFFLFWYHVSVSIMLIGVNFFSIIEQIDQWCWEVRILKKTQWKSISKKIIDNSKG